MRIKARDPCQRPNDAQSGELLMNLMMASRFGDERAVRRCVRKENQRKLILDHRYLMRGVSPANCDYDGRTALHVAACEGHVGVCLLIIAKAPHAINIKDRLAALQMRKTAVQIAHIAATVTRPSTMRSNSISSRC